MLDQGITAMHRTGPTTKIQLFRVNFLARDPQWCHPQAAMQLQQLLLHDATSPNSIGIIPHTMQNAIPAIQHFSPSVQPFHRKNICPLKMFILLGRMKGTCIRHPTKYHLVATHTTRTSTVPGYVVIARMSIHNTVIMGQCGPRQIILRLRLILLISI